MVANRAAQWEMMETSNQRWSYASEFEQERYDQACIIKTLGKFLDSTESGLDFDAFVRGYLQEICDVKRITTLDTLEKNWKEMSRIPKFDGTAPDGSKDIDVEQYLNTQDDNISELCNARDNSASQSDRHNKGLLDKYLDGFFSIAQKVVFSPENYNLTDNVFRQSKFLCHLMTYAKDKNADPDCEYSFLDPFALDTLERAFEGACILKASIKNEESTLLEKLRVSLFMSSVQSAFRRFISIDHRTYRIQLNRHTSRLAVIPYNQLSSIEEIKPVRLFEKIASYICDEAKSGWKRDRLSVNICILGHTEKSKKLPSDEKPPEAGLNDLMILVLKWYGRLRLDDIQKPNLDLNIYNVVSKGDGERAREYKRTGKDSISWDISFQSHTARCEVAYVDFEENFSFSSRRLERLIAANDIVFILDCPWLTTENLDIKKSGSLQSYCKILQKKKRNEPNVGAAFHSDFQSFYRHSTMRELDAQFNRIMSSDTLDSGEIVRVPKEPLLRRIDSIIRKKNEETLGKRSVVYLFTSERNGIDYSSIDFYPVTRTERYDGKSFTIVQYGGNSPAPLPLRKDGTSAFRIRLWTVIKYLSASFGYLDFKEAVRTCLGVPPKREVDYISIYRSIVVDGTVDPDLRTVRCQLRQAASLDDCLREIDSSLDTDEVKRRLLMLCHPFLRSIYCDVLFTDRETYGNDAIKIGFLMNLYGSARDVNTMLFYHKYRMAYRRKRCSEIKVVFEEPDFQRPDADTLDAHSVDFRDKKLYDCVLLRLEYSRQTTIGLNMMFHEANAVYGVPDARAVVLDNIMRACEAASMKNESLYINAQKMRQER